MSAKAMADVYKRQALAAAHDQYLAEGPLVSVRLPHGKGLPHEVRLRGLHRAHCARQEIRRDADVPDLHAAGAERSIPDELPRLGQGEGDGPVRPDGSSQHRCV